MYCLCSGHLVHQYVCSGWRLQEPDMGYMNCMLGERVDITRTWYVLYVLHARQSVMGGDYKNRICAVCTACWEKCCGWRLQELAMCCMYCMLGEVGCKWIYYRAVEANRNEYTCIYMHELFLLHSSCSYTILIATKLVFCSFIVHHKKDKTP